ncbi:TapB family protein [Zavarzinella formosa]|uniref:TapB family protein n=1 Tax=Zavarzinella formosa TaxID=360055 RepID=UPI000361F614|nr:hypothetical protein [Zavarzinella formosa]
MRHAVIALLAAGLPLLGAPAPKEKDKPVLYYATKVGDKRVYERRTHEPNVADTTSENTQLVTKVEEKDGRFLVTIRSDITVPPRPDLTFEVSQKGLFTVAINGMEHALSRQLLKLPAKAGDSWESNPELPKGSRTTYTMIGEEVIEVPAGKFKALRIESVWRVGGDLNGKQSCWYAPGVGLVKSLNEFPGIEQVTVLKSFTPGK